MNKPFEIYEEYRKAADFKSALGKRGLYEQNRINERFYIGDQWYGAKCGNDRPLVRHNIIKRIGDYKMSQILSAPLSVSFSAEGIPTVRQQQKFKIMTRSTRQCRRSAIITALLRSVLGLPRFMPRR